MTFAGETAVARRHGQGGPAKAHALWLLGVFTVAATSGAAGCGARTGLYAVKGETLDFDTVDAGDADLVVNGDPAGGSCAWSETIEAMTESDAGTECIAGPVLLVCDVAGSGASSFDNYCVTSTPSCSQASNPECQSQCESNEFGIVCSGSDLPPTPGCRVVWPSGATDGMVFCCACQSS